MKHIIYSLFTVLCIINANATTVKNLRVEYMRNPVGIDVANPGFSWEMESTETGQRQTAYQITLLAADKITEVWTSGKIASDSSLGVKYTGTTLLPSTRYFWKVSIWDKNDTEIVSAEEVFFETGLLDSGWSGAQWLQVSPKSVAGSSHFTVEADVTIINDNAAIIFSAANTSLFYMWSINTHDDANEPLLRRHFYNGNFSASDAKFGQYFSKADLINRECRLKIDITGNVIKTYIDNVLIDTYTDTNNQLIPSGVGFRSFKETGLDEKAYWDNIVLTDYSGNEPVIVLSESFENGNNFFNDGETALVDGNTKLYSFSPNDESRIFDDSFSGIPMFRAEFSLAKTLKSARIYSSALGVYDLFINGQRVGTSQAGGVTVYDELKPGWTDYRKTVFYSVYDITGLLVNGTNAIGAEVSSGWFNGKIAHNEYGQHPLAFIAKILLEYADGTTETIVTNTAAWKATTDSPIRKADIYDGETYDARKESAWTSAGFDDSQWRGTAVNNYFTGDRLAFIGLPVRIRPALEQTPKTIIIYDGIKPTSSTFGEVNIVRTLADGSIALKKGETAIYDFGQNIVGWIKFKVKGVSSAKIRGRFAEMLNDSGDESRGNDNAKGTLYLKNLRSAKATLNYTLKGDVQGETFRPSMTFFGFRYCEITASEDIVIELMKGEVIGNVNEENASFSTDNESINKLYSNIIWGQRGNFLSVPTDCPQRDERLGWMGDTQIFSRAATYNADVVSFFRKWAKDVRDSQQADGTYPSVVPDNWNVGYGRTAWAEAGIIVPWNVYLMYGDKEMLSKQYVSMEKFMNWMSQQKFDNYLYNGGNTQYGDWLAYENTDARFISVCYYAYVARLMTKISNALSLSTNDAYAQKAAQYQTLYNNIKAEFQQRYVNSRNGLLSVNTQTAYLLALQNDLFPNAENTQKAINHLIEKISTNGNKLSTGFVGTGILNQTLSEYGATGMAYNLLLQRENPSWLYSVDQGATTIWERWNSYTIASGFGDPGMNSFNHYSYGAVSEWMFRYMAGIEADENHPGFKHFILQPKPDTRNISENERIKTVDASFGSYYGEIKSKWERKADGNYRFTITVPANTSATLCIPKYNALAGVEQNGLAAENVEGVISFAREEKQFVLELVSGSYVFDTRNNGESGIMQVKKNDELKIYPNPATDKLFIDNGKLMVKGVEIYDISSKKMMNNKLSNGKLVNVSALPAGMYLLKIETESGNKTLKFNKK